MRFTVVLNPLENKVPVGNRMMGLSLMKSALKMENEDLFNELFFYGDKKSKKIKPITFSIYLNNFQLNNKDIDVNGNVLITFSTPCNRIGLTLFNGLIKMKGKKEGIFEYKNYKLQLLNIKIVKEKVIDSSLIKCKTLSPIYIKDRTGKSISVEERNKFEEELNYISNVFLESYRGNGLKEKLKFNSIYMKKIVVKEEVESFTNETNKKFMYINAYSGIFTLEGNKDDLRILFQSAIGFKRSQGFGLFDLI